MKKLFDYLGKVEKSTYIFLLLVAAMALYVYGAYKATKRMEAAIKVERTLPRRILTDSVRMAVSQEIVDSLKVEMRSEYEVIKELKKEVNRLTQENEKLYRNYADAVRAGGDRPDY